MKSSTDDLPPHAALKQFPVQHDCLRLGGEMRTAPDAGMRPSRISFAGPGKRSADLRGAVAAPLEVPV